MRAPAIAFAIGLAVATVSGSALAQNTLLIGRGHNGHRKRPCP